MQGMQAAFVWHRYTKLCMTISEGAEESEFVPDALDVHEYAFYVNVGQDFHTVLETLADVAEGGGKTFNVQ